jgi:hypothetical protein
LNLGFERPNSISISFSHLPSYPYHLSGQRCHRRPPRHRRSRRSQNPFDAVCSALLRVNPAHLIPFWYILPPPPVSLYSAFPPSTSSSSTSTTMRTPLLCCISCHSPLVDSSRFNPLFLGMSSRLPRFIRCSLTLTLLFTVFPIKPSAPANSVAHSHSYITDGACRSPYRPIALFT